MRINTTTIGVCLILCTVTNRSRQPVDGANPDGYCVVYGGYHYLGGYDKRYNRTYWEYR